MITELNRHVDDEQLLAHEIDDLLLQARGLVLVRDLLAERGATRTELDAHSDELARVREAGVAVNDEELAYGLRSIAAPVSSQSGEVVAALNLAVHRTMVSKDDLIVRYGPAVLGAARDISAGMGHRVT